MRIVLPLVVLAVVGPTLASGGPGAKPSGGGETCPRPSRWWPA